MTSNAFSQKKEKSQSKTKQSKVKVSDMELRLRLTDYFIRFSEDLEKAADIIYYESNNREVRKAALMWKIYGISAMSKAINMPDPVASFYNAWPLAKQMIYFFEEGEGKKVFNDEADLALQFSMEYETKLDQIIIDLTNTTHHKEAEAKVEEWVKNHLIQDFYFTRESTMAIFAKLIGAENMGLGKSVTTITEQVIELTNRLNLYVDMVPRQARWQIDYMMLNYMEDSLLTGGLTTLINSLDRISHIVEMTPEIIEYNREASFREIDEQREKSLMLLINERKAVIEEIRKERIELVAKIIEERMTVLEELKTERAIVLEEIKALSEETVLQSGKEIERIVDKVFFRVTILTLILGAVMILCVLLYKKL